MPEVRKQSFYIYEICDVANSDKTITKIKAKNNVGEYPVYAASHLHILIFIIMKNHAWL